MSWSVWVPSSRGGERRRGWRVVCSYSFPIGVGAPGHVGEDAAGVAGMVRRGLEALRNVSAGRAAAGDALFQRHIAEGQLTFYEGEGAFLREHRRESQHFAL